MHEAHAGQVQDAQQAVATAGNSTAGNAVSQPRPQNSKLKTQNFEFVFVLLGFTALTIVMTWPVAPLFWRAINAFGDVVVQMTTMAWDAHALTTNPLGIFEAPFFYPYAHTDAYSEHLIGETLIALPFFWLTNGDPAPAHNFNFLLSFVLTAAGTYLLVRDLTRNRVAAVAAGIAYAFAGYRFVQSGHMQTLATEWFPLTLWALRRGLNRNHGGYLALAAACCIGMGLFSVYYVFFLALLVALYVVWWLAVEHGRHLFARQTRPGPQPAQRMQSRGQGWPLWLKAGLAGLVTAIVLLPIYWPYVQVNQELGFNRSVYEVQGWAARIWYFWNVLPTNWLWVHLVPDMASIRGERELFPGLLITILAVVGVILGGRLAPRPTPAPDSNPQSAIRGALWAPQSDARERWFYLILAGVALLLTFGMSTTLPVLNVQVPLPYALLYDWVPGFSALRVPVRFVALLNLALAVLGGYGLAALLRGRTWRAAVVWLPLLALMTLEYVQVRDLSNNRDMRPPPAPAYTYLASHPGPVVELPMQGSDADVWYTYGVTYHWQPLVDGFSSFVPPGTVEIAHALYSFPYPASVTLLQGLGVKHALVHFALYSAADRAALQKRLAATPGVTQVFTAGDDAVYEIAPDLWPAKAVAELPPNGYLWLGRGSTGGLPALETIAYALKYNRLPGVALQVPADHVAGDIPLGYRQLPALPYGQAADVTLQPAGDPAGGAGTGATRQFYANPLAVLYARDSGLQAHYDLAAATSPYAPHGLALTSGGVQFKPPGASLPSTYYKDLLFAAFAPAQVTVADGQQPPYQITLAPGLTRYHTPVSSGGAPLDLHFTTANTSTPPALLGVDVYSAQAAPAAASESLTNTLVLDLEESTADQGAGTITTSWRVVPRHPGGGPFTLTLDIYQKPFGTHPDGHFGSWSLPLPAEAAGHRFTLTLHPVGKTATATLDGGGAQVYSWQGPPYGGDFTASFNLLSGDQPLIHLPVYDFTVDRTQITEFDPAPGAVVLLPFAP